MASTFRKNLYDLQDLIGPGRGDATGGLHFSLLQGPVSACLVVNSAKRLVVVEAVFGEGDNWMRELSVEFVTLFKSVNGTFLDDDTYASRRFRESTDKTARKQHKQEPKKLHS